MKQGCPVCGRAQAAVARRERYMQSEHSGVRYSVTDLMARIQAIHGNKYAYDKMVYTKMVKKVVITCPIHGDFQQALVNHIHKSSGCPSCGKTKAWTQEEFIAKAIGVHGDHYTYDRSVYVTSEAHVIITCSRHGDFRITPKKLITERQGCPECVKKNASKVADSWLEYVRVQTGESIQCNAHGGEKLLCFADRRCKVDGFAASTNTVYEFHGTFYHGHPDFYAADKMMPFARKGRVRTFGETYQATMDRDKAIQAAGYHLVVMWEHDWTNVVRMAVKIQRAWRMRRLQKRFATR